MTEAPNGLASLTQARERRVRRTMPPPRHPVGVAESAAAPESAASPEPAAVPTDTRVGEPLAPEPSEPSAELGPSRRQPITMSPKARTKERASTPKTTESAVTATATPIKPVTVYVSDEQNDFLEQVRIAGLIERVDISRSAVVRLALSRLQRDMSVDEIKHHLMNQPTDPNRTGRKRR